MSGHESDDERLAAFMDGRLDARGREEMLAHLTANEDARAALARAADVLRQLEEEDAAALPVPDEAARPDDEEAARQQADRPDTLSDELAVRRSRSPWVRLVLLAAVLAGVALVSLRVLRTGAAATPEPLLLAAQLEHGSEGLPAGWTERRPWTSVRGEDAGSAPSAGARSASSARAGALLVDLAVAVQARDSAATRVLATQIAARFDPRGGPLLQIASAAGSDPERLRPLIGEATERIEDLLDADALRIGAWAEAAGLAAARQDTAFFRDPSTPRTLARAERLAADDPEALGSVRSVRALLDADPPAWAPLAAALDSLARELATE